MRALRWRSFGIGARFVGALGAVLVWSWVLAATQTWWNTTVLALLYLLPVGLCTTVWGLRPGLVAALAAFFAFNYLFLEPRGTLYVHSFGDGMVLIVFLAVALGFNRLMARAQDGESTAQVRAHEATYLYELSATLTRASQPEALARLLVEHVLAFLHCAAAEVRWQSAAGHALSVHAPLDGPASTARPDIVVPMQTARGLLGELRVWLGRRDWTPEAARLLDASAGQGALALERAYLLDNETRAKVFEESDRLKAALLSSVSHDLRTPLATIKASASSLRSGAVALDSPAGTELITAIDEEADLLNRLVGDLLEMSRIEAGALKLRRAWNELGEIIESALVRLRLGAAAARVQVELPLDLPLVPVDYVLLEQVLVNLLGNSVKYAPGATPIEVRVRATATSVQVAIANMGPPVAEVELARIFEKFYRGTAPERVAGSGLGLSICKGLIEAHGGRIWAENAVPAGLVFVFELPLVVAGMPPPNLPVTEAGA